MNTAEIMIASALMAYVGLVIVWVATKGFDLPSLRTWLRKRARNKRS